MGRRRVDFNTEGWKLISRAGGCLCKGFDYIRSNLLAYEAILRSRVICISYGFPAFLQEGGGSGVGPGI